MSLTTEELHHAQILLGREPNALEREIIAAMWSEHCSYKSSRIHLKKLPKSGERVLVGPGENAGVIDVGDGLAVAFKVESHNHPSFIEPFQGAATGMGGILRDIFTMGARPFAAMNLLRFGDAAHPKTPRLLRGVVDVISHYGNCFGVPTVMSDVAHRSCYNGNILVNAFAIGVLKHDKIYFGAAKGVGNLVFYVGAKTGRDGIHGATMASDSFSDAKEVARPTVQVGDPFKEKLLLEACQECFAEDLLVGIQDMGAAGLTCSSFEMAARAGTGMALHLDRVPMREEGMTPYEIMLSESQERMMLVVEEGKAERIVQIFTRWDLDCVEVGRVTSDGLVQLFWHGDVQAVLPAVALTEGAPVYERPWKVPQPIYTPTATLDKVDKTWVYEQYDRHIGLGTLVDGQEADAALVQIPGSQKAVALVLLCDEEACAREPREGAMRTLTSGVLRVSCVGATPIGISDCLNYGSPETEQGMGQLVAGIEGIADAAKLFGLPVVSGNVSLYNETDGKPIYPTPAIAVVGLHENPARRAVNFFEQAGDLIMHLSGDAKPLADAIRFAVQEGIVTCAHHAGPEGLLSAVTEMASRNKLGTQLISEELPDRYPQIVLSLPREKLPQLESALPVEILLREIGVVTNG